MSEAPSSGVLSEGALLAGRYRILRKLGEGAMGAVYLAEHLKMGRLDAIKVLREGLASDREAIARFLRGARNVAAIRHPNVCAIYDFTETDAGVGFLAMEYVEGPTLKQVLEREGPLPPERAVGIAAQTADALQAAHEAGIVHRDLKPGNIMIMTGRNGRDVVKVVDFDIAKGAEEGGDEVTRMGFVVGTPEYMSPEQLMGEPLDGRSDLYALGTLLFRMLTGVLPFSGEATQDLMVARLTSPPLRLDAVLPDVHFPPGVQAALDRALQRRPADRQTDVAQFARELRSVAHPTSADEVAATRFVPAADPETAMGTAESPVPRSPQPSRRRLYGALGAGGALVLAVAAFLWAGGQGEGGANPMSQQPLVTGPGAVTAPTGSETTSGETGGGGQSSGAGGGGGQLAGTAGGERQEPPQPNSQEGSSPRGGRDGPAPTSRNIVFSSSLVLDDVLLDLNFRLTESVPAPASLRGIQDTLMAALEQSRDNLQRRSSARLLALLEHHRGDLAACRRWGNEVRRLGGAVADLDGLCPPPPWP